MRFGILGPIFVHDDHAPRELPAAKQRILLAALLLQAGRSVSPEVLADAIWDGEPPASALVTVRNYVLRLRRALGPAGARIVTGQGGYLIRVEAHEFDVLQFAALRRQGTAALRQGAVEQAARLLGEAVDLWRGPALADVPSDLLHGGEASRLAELRLDTTELKLEAELRLGAYTSAIAELRGLTASNPGREALWAQLMSALYRSGRQAEALAAYHDARRFLIEEFGVEPGPRLRAAQQRILTAGRHAITARPPGAGTAVRRSCTSRSAR